MCVFSESHYHSWFAGILQLAIAGTAEGLRQKTDVVASDKVVRYSIFRKAAGVRIEIKTSGIARFHSVGVEVS
jgi:hypothetical protein